MFRILALTCACVLLVAGGLAAQRPGTGPVRATPPPRPSPPPGAQAGGDATRRAREQGVREVARRRIQRGGQSGTGSATGLGPGGAPAGGAGAPGAAEKPREFEPEALAKRSDFLVKRFVGDYARVRDGHVIWRVRLLDAARGKTSQRDVDVFWQVDGEDARYRVSVIEHTAKGSAVSEDYIVFERRGKTVQVWQRDDATNAFVPAMNTLGLRVLDSSLTLEDFLPLDPERYALAMEKEELKDGVVTSVFTAKPRVRGARFRRIFFANETRLPIYWEEKEGGKVLERALTSAPTTRDGIRMRERRVIEADGGLTVAMQVTSRQANRGVAEHLFDPAAKRD